MTGNRLHETTGRLAQVRAELGQVWECHTAARDPVKAPAIRSPTPGSFTCICKAHRDETEEEEEDLMNNSPGRQDSCPGAASP